MRVHASHVPVLPDSYEIVSEYVQLAWFGSSFTLKSHAYIATSCECISPFRGLYWPPLATSRNPKTENRNPNPVLWQRHPSFQSLIEKVASLCDILMSTGFTNIDVPKWRRQASRNVTMKVDSRRCNHVTLKVTVCQANRACSKIFMNWHFSTNQQLKHNKNGRSYL